MDKEIYRVKTAAGVYSGRLNFSLLMKWTQNNRQTDEKRNVFVWDLKEGRKRIAQIWSYPEKFKPGGKILCFCNAFCFRKEKPDNQTIDDFKEEMKKYFEDYNKTWII